MPARMPWHFRVTVVIPHRDTPLWLHLTVHHWLKQRERPFVLVLDTSTHEEGERGALALRELEGVEVASLGVGTTEHPCDAISAAMDYAFSRCPTPYLLATHTDVIPRHRDLVGHLVDLCDEKRPVVGWEMSPRGAGPRGVVEGTLSDGFPGHACTLFHVPTMDRIGAGWALRRAANAFGYPRTRVKGIAGWPDTETCIGALLKEHNIKPVFLGRETNHENQWTEHWVHARSLTSMGRMSRHGDVLDWAFRQLSAWYRQDDEAIPQWLDRAPHREPGVAPSSSKPETGVTPEDRP